MNSNVWDHHRRRLRVQGNGHLAITVILNEVRKKKVIKTLRKKK